MFLVFDASGTRGRGATCASADVLLASISNLVIANIACVTLGGVVFCASWTIHSCATNASADIWFANVSNLVIASMTTDAFVGFVNGANWVCWRWGWFDSGGGGGGAATTIGLWCAAARRVLATDGSIENCFHVFAHVLRLQSSLVGIRQ
jgi:uncharacterized membrane protein